MSEVDFIRVWARRMAIALAMAGTSAVAWLHAAAPINLTTADLGRHIQNGAQFFLHHQILSTNFYSYTHPETWAPCHHWGIGPLFYGIWKAWDFSGLSFFYAGLLTLTFWLCVWSARRASSFSAALLMGLLALPLIGYRSEIRPEGVSTFFIAIYYVLLSEYRMRRLSGKWLWVLPVLQMFWVNIHILFFCGLVILGIFVVDAFLYPKDRQPPRDMLMVLIASAAACMIGPFGLTGFLAPLFIFKAYGYKLAENQNVLFMIKRFPGRSIYEYTLVVFGMGAVLVGLRLWNKRLRDGGFIALVLFVFFGFLALKAVRMIGTFGFLFIPLGAEGLYSLGKYGAGRYEKVFHRCVTALAALMLLGALTVPYFYLSPVRKFQQTMIAENPAYQNSIFQILVRPHVWGGLASGVNGAAEFFKSQGMKGPIFNNYDIGGYLIFHLFPGERPFVDNRPEAYPVTFFSQVYAPMQTDEVFWHDMVRKEGFQVIFFYRHDMTDWGQPFLIRRLADPQWAPVYVDGYSLILARRGGVNQKVIDQYELPKDIFKITHP
ncbi:MAG: hypothetical protein HQL19_03840 [Candidatus Omnitrophica bacterium]|nr:hypothetical protein [Candidatus Omnitrophota bacterium]